MCPLGNASLGKHSSVLYICKYFVATTRACSDSLNFAHLGYLHGSDEGEREGRVLEEPVHPDPAEAGHQQAVGGPRPRGSGHLAGQNQNQNTFDPNNAETRNILTESIKHKTDS
jgi:hypothetical protein